MTHNWILEVLEDLEKYLSKNQLHKTLEQTRRLISVTKAEIGLDTGSDVLQCHDLGSVPIEPALGT